MGLEEESEEEGVELRGNLEVELKVKLKGEE